MTNKSKRKVISGKITLFVFFYVLIRAVFLIFSREFSLQHILLFIIFVGITLLMIMDIYIPRIKKAELEVSKGGESENE